MLETAFITVHGWLTASGPAAYGGSFLWGVVSVMLSPCHLASIPLIVSYVGGQETSVRPARAAYFALTFTLGLFITIALVGLASAAAGIMLGDIGPYWGILVGIILIWLALDMMGLMAGPLSGGLMSKIKVRGIWGAFVLGLTYGLLSGSCTFGFIAPILALISIQQDMLKGLWLVLLFGIGHSLPIVIAGSSTALVGRVLENGVFQKGSLWFRRTAGLGIAFLGFYFIVSPFVSL